LDEIIENCHAHLDGMIDQMELTANRDSDRSEDHEGAFEGHEGLQAEEDEDKKISMTSLIAPSDMTVHSHYNSFRTSMFNASSYASSLSSFSDDDEFKPLYISDDEEAKEVEAKLSRRTSRVKSLNKAQKSLDEAIKLLAATITERVMLEAKSIAAKESTQSLDSAYNGSIPTGSTAGSIAGSTTGSTRSITGSGRKLDSPDLNEITDHIAHQIVTDAIQKAQDQILLHSTQRSFGTFWDHGVVSQPQDGALESIANQIVLNAIQTAKNQLSK